jgi:hypothetical protein
MIFGQDRVSYDDFGDCHNEIAIADGQFVVFICKERGAFGSPLQGQRLRVIDLIVDGRGEKFKVSR